MKLILSFAAALLVFGGSQARAQLNSAGSPPPDKPTPYRTGAIVGQFIGRFVMAPDGSGEVVGYLPLIEGIGSNLFAGATQTEQTALFSLRSDRMTLAKIPNGSFNHFLLAPAASPGATTPAAIHYRVYYNAAPNRNFNSPGTFSDGTLVATLTAGNGMVTLTPVESEYQANLTLDATTVFVFGAKVIDLANFGSAVTVQTTGGLIPLSLANGASVPLAGFLTAAAQ